MNEILNAAFFVFHTSWILFTCLGWIWRQTRPWQLATVVLTAASYAIAAAVTVMQVLIAPRS